MAKPKAAPKPRAKPAPKPPTETAEAFWAGPFGDEYTDRNAVDWRARIPFLRRMVESTGAGSFLDVGCNAGWNMLALREINSDFEMTGIDVNHQALQQAQSQGLDVINMPAMMCSTHDDLGPGVAEMVITSGVLIHVPPEQLRATMLAIRDASARYVLAIEYDAPAETEVEYRGHAGRLWKRPFGDQFVELGGMSLVETGTAEGYDQCKYWLLEVA